jgi:hypothetical protein
LHVAAVVAKDIPAVAVAKDILEVAVAKDILAAVVQDSHEVVGVVQDNPGVVVVVLCSPGVVVVVQRSPGVVVVVLCNLAAADQDDILVVVVEIQIPWVAAACHTNSQRRQQPWDP